MCKIIEEYFDYDVYVISIPLFHYSIIFTFIINGILKHISDKRVLVSYLAIYAC